MSIVLFKLLIIAIVLAVGVIVFQEQLKEVLPNTTSAIQETIKDDVSVVTSMIEERAGGALDTITEGALNVTTGIIQP
ncbi:MAG: hypothetical protein F4W68_00695 [Cenarchaeum sp. SB0661_bin_35]|nr:hypothetical protein [Cenarchaeum sp. SB0667_bin_13]MXZ94158.1 hypothetical protein [Cenarchaeum sp. SB0666_bin_15]MYB46652.1 hypothetical protein [Cenarchaeum sp. SB0662_bin_33]MYC79017.1 hypothetical protein [Cenarchaeum sp. SB0661_bin_35]MYD58092.1 hypothetical protein [Cenarchaeum sp. SB0678_bin_8]MYG32567.1 hypothetical protein [Cenarchaeum sp. SB0677_bin_16]MYJ27483.1 hypothetical protein [Cenarchaeum sp. SB0672_bin_9]